MPPLPRPAPPSPPHLHFAVQRPRRRLLVAAQALQALLRVAQRLLHPPQAAGLLLSALQLGVALGADLRRLALRRLCLCLRGAGGGGARQVVVGMGAAQMAADR